MRGYRAARSGYREQDNERRRRRYHADPEAHCRRTLENYYAKHDGRKARKRAYAATHRAGELDRKRRWRAENVDRERARNRAKERNRRALMAASAEHHTERQVLALLRLQGGRCFYCDAALLGGYHADHVVPLARGGRNGPGNLAVACAACNQSKGAKLPLDWAMARTKAAAATAA